MSTFCNRRREARQGLNSFGFFIGAGAPLLVGKVKDARVGMEEEEEDEVLLHWYTPSKALVDNASSTDFDVYANATFNAAYNVVEGAGRSGSRATRKYVEDTSREAKSGIIATCPALIGGGKKNPAIVKQILKNAKQRQAQAAEDEQGGDYDAGSSLEGVGGDNVGRPKVKGWASRMSRLPPAVNRDNGQEATETQSGGRHLRANGEGGTRGGARGRRLLKVGQAVAGGSRKDVGRSLGRKCFGGLDRTKLFACRGYGLVSQLFIVDAGVSLELFSVFVGQCACLYVLDDSFRFCKYRQESCCLSTLLYAVEMTWRTIRKCNQFINVWPSLQMKNNIIFIISEQVRCTRSLANQTRLFVCLHHQWKIYLRVGGEKITRRTMSLRTCCKM